MFSSEASQNYSNVWYFSTINEIPCLVINLVMYVFHFFYSKNILRRLSPSEKISRPLKIDVESCLVFKKPNSEISSPSVTIIEFPLVLHNSEVVPTKHLKFVIKFKALKFVLKLFIREIKCHNPLECLIPSFLLQKRKQ